MRAWLAVVAVSCGACRSVSVTGHAAAGSTGSSASRGGSSSGGALTTGGSTTGARVLLPGPCGPGTSWLGDACITVSCSTPVSGTSTAYCELPDGGLGACLAGDCVDPRMVGNCGQGCPDPAQTCVGNGVCAVSSCSPADHDMVCALDGGNIGFCCGGSCVAGPQNCGGCGNVCPLGTACADTVCVPVQTCGAPGWAPYGSCALPDGARGFCCATQCLDSNSETSCGICGESCATVPSCQFGICGDGCGPDTFGSCDASAGVACAAVPGGMEYACFPLSCSGEAEGWGCVADGGAMGACRSGVCKSLVGCGLTGIACQPNELCYQGSYCRPLLDCSQGGGSYPEDACRIDGGLLGMCCGNVCVDLTTTANCGTCDLACPAGQSCGIDRRGGGFFTDCDHLGCKDEDCPPGDLCDDSGDCLPTACDGGQIYCNLAGDIGHCCGTTCTASNIECEGGCGSQSWGSRCSSGVDEWLCCGTVCTDLAQDPKNCFGCGVVCPSGVCADFSLYFYGGGRCLPAGPTSDCKGPCPQGSVCLDGQCIDGSCEDSSFCLAQNGTIGMCCGDAACAHPLDDPQNCGLCGNACGPGGACVNGSCSDFPGCGLGRMNAYCNFDAGADFLCCPSIGCTDVKTDPRNCNSCGQPCGRGQVCVGGICQAPSGP